jgi:hypothetical protein
MMKCKTMMVVGLALLLLSACHAQGSMSGSVYGQSTDQRESSVIEVNAGDDFVMDYHVAPDSGLVEISVVQKGSASRDPYERWHKKFEQEEEGTITLPMETDGNFIIIVNTTRFSGTYGIDWELFAWGKPDA